MNKKFLAILLTLAMVLSLVACGAKEDSLTDAPAVTPVEDGAYKIALIQQHQTNAFQIAVTEAAEAKQRAARAGGTERKKLCCRSGGGYGARTG